MYEGLYDTQKGLSDRDARRIGLMTARLLNPWSRWVHRRVERITFCDEDALNRDVSIDFTLPIWFHELRETPPCGLKRQLVPLGFLRKGPLVNFGLRNERDESLPLLTRPQNAQVSEAILKVLALRALDPRAEQDPDISPDDIIPSEVRCDIRDLVRESPAGANEAYGRLLTNPDKASDARATLGNNRPFVVAANLFRYDFLALSMLSVNKHERRVVHLSYEEARSSSTTDELRRIVRQMRGKGRRLTVDVTALSETMSHHVEVEAPSGLKITGRASYYFDGRGNVVGTKLQPVTYKRAHFHFFNAQPRSSASVAVQLRPRESSGVRAATLMALFTFLATSLAALRFAHIEHGDNAAAAALLLAAAGIIGLVVVRGGEDEVSTTLLFPLRVLATFPVLLAACAAVVIVGDPTHWLGYLLLGFLSALIGASAFLLTLNWRILRR